MLKSTIFVSLFFVVQMVVVHVGAGAANRPTPPNRAIFPSEIGGWKYVQDDPVDPGVAAALGADQIVSRNYVDEKSHTAGNLFLAWFQWQQEGTREPHSPKVCLPASGWVTDAADLLSLDTSAGRIVVNRYLIHHGAERGAMLFWYQRGRRVISGEWGLKLWSVADGVLERRTDAAFVRTFVQYDTPDPAGALSSAISMASLAYPRLVEYLPR